MFNVSDCKDVIKDNENDLLISPKSLEDIIEVLEKLINYTIWNIITNRIIKYYKILG